MHLPTSKHRAVRHLLSHLLHLLGILHFFHCGCSPFFQSETRAELSAEMSSATLPAKGLNSRAKKNIPPRLFPTAVPAGNSGRMLG